MTEPTCKTCPFRPERRCLRFPPTAAVGAPAIWPVTQDTDWCGEHPERATFRTIIHGPIGGSMATSGPVAPSFSVVAPKRKRAKG